MADSRATNPLVSVLMTAYNRSGLIADAIESVVNSTYENFELIIVDDCSIDDTYEIAKTYESRDARVKVYKNEVNLGDYHNRNRAASFAKGKYIKYLDSDDVIYRYGLSAMVSYMEMYPDAGFALSENAYSDKPHPVKLTPKEAYIRNYLHNDLFGRAPGSGIIKSETFKKVGGFSGKQYIGDHELWLALAREAPMVTMPRDLVWDRTHTDQQKNFDVENPAKITTLHYQLDLDALNHKHCPLSKQELDLVKKSLTFKNQKIFWNLLFTKKGWRSAFKLRRNMNLDWKGLFAMIYFKAIKKKN